MNVKIELYKEYISPNTYICGYLPKQRADIRQMIQNLRKAGFTVYRVGSSSNKTYARVDYYKVFKINKKTGRIIQPAIN